MKINNEGAASHLLAMLFRVRLAFLVLVITVCGYAQGQESGTKPAGAITKDESKRIVREGIAIELKVDPLVEAGAKGGELVEGQGAVVQIKITDTATNNPVTNLHPVAWMSHQSRGQATETQECKEKIKSFLQGTLRVRPDIDLNTYYMLTMNRDPSISVIDPLLGYGGSKLLAMALLKSPGEDWVLTADKRLLFVTMPLVNQVAVVDTATWKVVTNITVGVRPVRIVLQQDQKYVWVGNDGLTGSDAPSGVSVIDARDLIVKATITTGAGHHEIAFNSDDRFSFITNKLDGTLTVVDVQKLEKVKDIPVGKLPASVAFSPLSKAVYVANEGDGTIAAVDGRTHQVVARIQSRPGVRALRFSPDGRWGFAVNSLESALDVIDSSNNNIQQTVPVGKEPDQVVFTEKFAYVRSIGSEEIDLINLSSIARGEKAAAAKFSGGQYPLGSSSNAATASAIAPAPEGTSVLIANAADKQIYYFMEGMSAPMGSFQTYKREPKAVLVVDKSLRETSPGVYSTNVKLTSEGSYDFALMLNTPKITHCFQVGVRADTSLASRRQARLRVEPLFKPFPIAVGQPVQLKFKLTDPETRQPRVGLKDVSVLAMLAPGITHKRQWARSVGDGVYEVTFTPLEPGPYYIFVECASLGARYNQMPYVILMSTDQKAAEPEKGSQKPSATSGG